MSTIVESIDVEVPVGTAYDQWTQFESFPQFMEGVKSVRQLDDTTLEWVAEIAGREERWKARITEQEPDQRVAWTATEGAKNAGVVTFHRLAEGRTRVTLQLEVEPEGPIETIGDALGIVQRRVKGDLERFKAFIEDRGAASGAWRGTSSRPPADPGPAPIPAGPAADPSTAPEGRRCQAAPVPFRIDWQSRATTAPFAAPARSPAVGRLRSCRPSTWTGRRPSRNLPAV